MVLKWGYMERKMSQYHAVVAGYQTGIFTDWAIVRNSIQGYPGAIYKSFNTYDEAKSFMFPDKGEEPKVVLNDDNKKGIIVYTDGSAKDNRAGFGIVIIHTDGKIEKHYGPMPSPPSGESKEHMHNKAELFAIYASLNTIKGDMTIYCDSMYCVTIFQHHIFVWGKSGWKDVANSYLLKPCFDLMQGRKIRVEHVSGHNGIHYNEMADALSKMGREYVVGQEKPVFMG